MAPRFVGEWRVTAVGLAQSPGGAWVVVHFPRAPVPRALVLDGLHAEEARAGGEEGAAGEKEETKRRNSGLLEHSDVCRHIVRLASKYSISLRALDEDLVRHEAVLVEAILEEQRRRVRFQHLLRAQEQPRSFHVLRAGLFQRRKLRVARVPPAAVQAPALRGHARVDRRPPAVPEVLGAPDAVVVEAHVHHLVLFGILRGEQGTPDPV